MSSSAETNLNKVLNHTSHVIDAYVASEAIAKPDDFGERDLENLISSLRQCTGALVTYEELKDRIALNPSTPIVISTQKAIETIQFKRRHMGNSPLEQKKKLDFVVALAALEQFQNSLRNVIERTRPESDEARKRRSSKVEETDTDMLT